MTDKELLSTYVKLAEFMSLCFSEDVEVLVHDVEHLDRSAIAIFNNHISDREAGAPMTRLGCEFIADKLFERDDWVVNYKGITDKGVVVRSSTFFIKNAAGKLIGSLCVNVDMRKYQAVKRLAESMVTMLPLPGSGGEPEILTTGSDKPLEKAVDEYCARVGRTVDMLGMDDRLDILRDLLRQGFFERKGAIGDIAGRLNISEPSVYRYLKTIKKGQ